MRGICIVKKLRIRKFQNKLVTERKVIYIIKNVIALKTLIL